ncbi:hypothetical protein PG994_007053 [Apiospora phragmitis]|uniref:Uncharacterized protein n=1 Tax=Apiospora phragmitis TaxID=2905665 RepID=A0ABR1V2C4_9PEZI
MPNVSQGWDKNKVSAGRPQPAHGRLEGWNSEVNFPSFSAQELKLVVVVLAAGHGNTLNFENLH